MSFCVGLNVVRVVFALLSFVSVSCVIVVCLVVRSCWSFCLLLLVCLVLLCLLLCVVCCFNYVYFLFCVFCLAVFWFGARVLLSVVVCCYCFVVCRVHDGSLCFWCIDFVCAVSVFMMFVFLCVV